MSHIQARRVGTLALLISVITVFGALAAYPPPQFSDHEASGQESPPLLGGGLSDLVFANVASNENTLNNVISLRVLNSDIFTTSVDNSERSNLTYTFPNNGVSTTPGSSNTITFDTSTQAGIILGHLRYTIQDPSFSGVDTFTWTISHSDGRQATGTVTVTVAEAVPLGGGLSDLAFANVASNENTLNNVISLRVLNSDIFTTSVDNSERSNLTYTFPNNGVSTTPGSSNTITFDTSTQAGIILGHLRYTIQDPSFSGVDTFTWTISHSDGRQATGTVTVIAEAPLLGGGLEPLAFIVTSADNTLGNTVSERYTDSINIFTSFRGLGDLSFSDLTYTFPNGGVSTTEGSNNTLTFEANSSNPAIVGSLIITINNPAFSGTDNFTWTISHTNGSQATGTITVTVAEAPQLGDGLVDRIYTLRRADNTLGNTESVLILTGSDIFNSIAGFGGFSLSDLTITFPNGGVSTTEGQ